MSLMSAKSSDWRPGPSVCRCCFAEGCYKDISTEYFWMGKREVYQEMLSDTFDVSISYSLSGGPNSNSRLICEPCISRLRDASDFKRQVQECERVFQQHLDPSTSGADLEALTDAKEVKLERVKLESKMSDDDDDFDGGGGFDDDDDDDLDDQPLTKLATKVPKKESIDLMDLLDNAKPEKRKAVAKPKASPAKKIKLTKKTDAPKPSVSKPAPKPAAKKKGLIQESDSSIVMKNEDGSETKLTVLKTPISLDKLKVEYEENTKKKTIKRDPKMITIKVKRNLSKKKKVVTVNKVQTEKVPDEVEQYKMNVSLLKEPLSLENINWGEGTQDKTVTFNVKTVQRTFIRSQTKKDISPELEIWKQNALTIFENSYVYPFIYANNKYKCFACAKPFLNENILKDHTLGEHSMNDIKQELSNRVRDKNLKVDVTYLQCKICLQTPPNLSAMKFHLKDHGKEIDPHFKDNIVPYKLSGETFDCQMCGEAFLKLRLLIIHMSTHFNNYSCEVCGSMFISLRDLKRHHQVHESGNFPCDKCDKIFSSSGKRSIHMRGVHLKKFPRRCPICSERFNSNYQRTKHLRVVHNQSTGMFRCDTCGREFDLKYHLLVHIRSVHLQERNQECPVCHFRFFSKNCLSRHMVIHTNEKNFKCEVCGKAYTRKKNLREHARVHELGASTCGVCGKNCGDQAGVVAHVNVTHGVGRN